VETSILNSTKKNLGLDSEYSAFDHDIISHINSAFSVLWQLGVGPIAGFEIEDDSLEWDDFDIPVEIKNLVKTYIYLKVRMLFDPPNTSFGIAAMEKQLADYEYRINYYREDTAWMASQAAEQ
jgi:hypothetical protein